jgi:hypothetical protein
LTRAVVGTGPELTAANALNTMSASVLRLIAPPLGALVLAVEGFGADAGKLAVSAWRCSARRAVNAAVPPGPVIC